MGINYAQMRATALRLITENGTTGILSRETVTGYDPLTDIEVATRQDYPVTLVVLPFSSGDSVALDLLAASGFVLSNVEKVLIPAQGLPAGFVPAPGDYLTSTGGRVWTILSTLPLLPDGSPVMHTCIVQSGASRP